MIDAIPIRGQGKDFQVGVLKRGKPEQWWPGMWHLPGTVFRSTDTLDDAFQRLFKNEIRAAIWQAPIFRDFLVHQSDRGAELVLIHTVEGLSLEPDSTLHWMFPSDPPQPFIESEQQVLSRLYQLMNV